MNISDKLGDTALHWAARGGAPDVVKKLIKSGCKVKDLGGISFFGKSLLVHQSSF